MDVASRTLLIGIGATAVMDVWALLARRLFQVPTSNWALVGRWLGHFPRGKFRPRHRGRGGDPRRARDRVDRALRHRGVAYAALLIVVAGVRVARRPHAGAGAADGHEHARRPVLPDAARMGYGIAASRTARPGAARLRSLMNHGVFGLGLYVSALAV